MADLVYIDNEGITNPRINLAIEEYALRNLDPRYDYLLFYVNEPSIIIGRGQNTIEEVDRQFVKENGIHVVRRLSGGGAVYHDAGNLNFSFITDPGEGRLHNFRYFTEPVARVLRQLGVDAEPSGRNDLVVDGRKVSGNAQFSTRGRMVSHGTLLFNSDLVAVTQALRVSKGKLQAKALASVRSRVANIAEHAEREVDVATLQKMLLEGLFAGREMRRYQLNGRDWDGVRKLIDERYSRWEWNVASTPPFEVQRAHRFSFGEVDVRLDVRKGRIADARIHGDFLATAGTTPIVEALRNVPYDVEPIQQAVRKLDLTTRIPGLSHQELVALLHPDAPEG